ncbi:MAG TPA: TRAP transporter large permease subunit [Gammaproteobacteria bacterium]|nr:TRAP transporter large permease subunit [Gammaproteobacteria bacterium]
MRLAIFSNYPTKISPDNTFNLGFDPIAFAIFGIPAIEADSLTPPVGLLVYTLKGTTPNSDLDSVRSSADQFPTGCYWVLVIVLVWWFHELAAGSCREIFLNHLAATI